MSLQYIIDGYNLINHPLFSRAEKHSFDPSTALTAFIKINRLTGSLKNKVTIVFDGYPPSAGGDCVDSSINVVFSRDISADDKIKIFVEQTANRKNIIVVSDDREIKLCVQSLGACSKGIEDFITHREKSGNFHKQDSAAEQKLNYSQMQKINQELKKIWLE